MFSLITTVSGTGTISLQIGSFTVIHNVLVYTTPQLEPDVCYNLYCVVASNEFVSRYAKLLASGITVHIKSGDSAFSH